MTGTGFLDAPAATAGGQALFDDDLADYGYVMNASRLWAYQPATHDGLFELMRQTLSEHRLSIRERGILVAACASTLTDSYCSLAWGSKLAAESDADIAANVLRGGDDGLSAPEQAMAAWARKVARDPNHTTAADVQALRAAGFDDAQIFSITVFVALRLAFSTVNDALGAQPDAQFRASAPEPVLDAVTYGRPIEPAVGPTGRITVDSPDLKLAQLQADIAAGRARVAEAASDPALARASMADELLAERAADTSLDS